MLGESISRSKAFIVRALSYFEAIIVYHSHPTGSPEMSRKPLNFLTTHFIGGDEMTPLSNVFTAFWQFLHTFCFS